MAESTRDKHYHYRQRLVEPWERPNIMRKHIYTGAMGSIYYYAITGVFFAQFARDVGVTIHQFGILSAFACIALSMQIFSARIVEYLGHRKMLWLTSALTSRAFRAIGFMMAVVLFRRDSSSPMAAGVLIGAMMTATLFEAFATPPWLSWLADIIPEEEHGTFWGRRQAWVALVAATVILPFGLVVDIVPEHARRSALLGVFMAAIALSFIDIIIHRTIPEPFMKPVRRKRLLHSIMKPIKDRQFRRWLVFGSAWNIAMMLSAPLVWVFFVEDLGMSRSFLITAAVTTAFPLLGTLFFGKALGRWIDEVGTRRALFVSHLMWASLPGVWFFATKEMAFICVGIAGVVGGTFAQCATNAGIKLITRIPPEEDRTMYIAVSSCIGSLAAALGAYLGAALAGLLEGWSLSLPFGDIGPFRAVFALGFVLRIGAACLALRVPNTETTPQT